MDKELIESQIKLLQDLILTYQQYNASEDVVQTAKERLTELQESAK